MTLPTVDILLQPRIACSERIVGCACKLNACRSLSGEVLRYAMSADKVSSRAGSSRRRRLMSGNFKCTFTKPPDAFGALDDESLLSRRFASMLRSATGIHITIPATRRSPGSV
eukprot:3274390-Pyramimonas_sp.AAC.1